MHLKKELELSRIWSALDRALVEREVDQSVFARTKMKRRWFEELYHDTQDRLVSQLRAGASRGPKSKYARELAPEYLAIKTALYRRSRFTSAAIADYETQILMHEDQATNLTEDRQEQIYHRVEAEVFGVESAAQVAFRQAMYEKRRQYDQGWEVRKGPALRKRLASECFHFGKPKMHLLSYYQEFIIRIGASDNFSTYISELLHISNEQDAY